MFLHIQTVLEQREKPVPMSLFEPLSLYQLREGCLSSRGGSFKMWMPASSLIMFTIPITGGCKHRAMHTTPALFEGQW